MKNPARLLHLIAFAFACLASAQAQTTWTQRNQAAGTGETLWSVVEGNAGIVAVGTGGKIVYSLDGKTWTPRASGFNGWLVAVTCGNNRYIAVGEGGTVLSSTDTITWTSISATGTTARLNNVLYAQGKFVAVGEGGVIIVSSDGVAWSAATSGVTGWLRGLVYAGGMWVATGQSGAVTTSGDSGKTWSRRAMTNNLDLEAVVFSEGAAPPGFVAQFNGRGYDGIFILRKFLAVGADGISQSLTFIDIRYPDYPSQNSSSASSSLPLYYDPSTRTNLSGTGTTARLRSLAKVNNLYVATGENGTVITAKSPNGPWSPATIATAKNLVGSGIVQGALVLVGESEAIFQSEPIFLSRLGNISTRGPAQTGDKIMIAGTVIQGSRPKQILVRGIGPALTAFGVGGVLADPVLSVFNGAGNLVAANTAWGTNANAAAIVTASASAGAFPLTANSKDSALLLTLSPGSYTFQLKSASGASGNVLIEAYDLDPIDATSPRAINISTRGQVGTGDSIMIAGLVVQGQASRTLLIRGVGPTLAGFGVSDTLADPIIKIVANDGTVLATNDNWSDDTIVNGRTLTADEIRAVTAVCGAFALADGSKDAALVITLLPGNYTIQVTGKNNGTGVAIVEAYDVPQN